MKPIIYTDDKNSEYIRDSHIYEDLIKKIANMNSELKELDNTLISIKSILSGLISFVSTFFCIFPFI